MQLDEALTADGRIGDGVVVGHDEVKTGLEEVVVQPFGDLGFHLTEFLGSLSSAHSLHQIGASCKPVANLSLIGIVGSRQFERIAHTIEGFCEGIFGIEPAETLVQLSVRPEAHTIQLQGRLLAHLFHGLKRTPECGCNGITFTDFCF